MLSVLLVRTDELLRRSEPKTRPKKVKDTRTLEEQLEPFRGRYGKGMIDDFIRYWSEKDKKGNQRWQKEPTWEINLRLERRQKQLDDWAWEKTQRQELKKVEEKPIHREAEFFPPSTNVDTRTGFASMDEMLKKYRV